jgi:Putative MetA-pathway of phenol degradation
LRRIALVAVVCLLIGFAEARGQQLEPRVYLASPVGSNVVVAAVGRSTGDIIVDPTLPIEDARARLGVLTFAYYRSFSFLGRSASLGGALPVLRGSAEGRVDGIAQRVDRLGQGDVPVRLTVNVVGAPAMDTPTFAKRPPRPELAVSLVATVPIGQYDPTKIINLGANRWSYKPEVGLSLPIGERWRFDAYGGVWLFSDNTNFRGRTREQRPLLTTQFHLSYNLSRRAWAALDGTFYSGGRTVTEGKPEAERVNNSRVGGTLSFSIAARQALRIAASRGAWVRLGSNFTTLGVTWSYAWGRGF